MPKSHQSPQTTHDAIDNLHESLKILWGVSVEESAQRLAQAFQIPPPTANQIKWALRTHLKDGTPIVEPPN